MAITREQKTAQLTKLLDDFAKAKMTVLADYQGLSVQQLQTLRAQLKTANCSLRVVKNTLMRLAADQHPPFQALDKKVFDGPLALVFGYEDEVAPAQTVANFAKVNEKPAILGAVNAQGDYLTAEQAQHLATLPTKEQLLGQFVGVLAAPISGFVNVLSGNLRGLVQVLHQFRQQQST